MTGGQPENHTLRLLREMREENARLHAETREQLGKALDALVEVARSVNTTAEAAVDPGERLGIVEARLNTIDARLARIERVKA
jgi:hypothetical protein